MTRCCGLSLRLSQAKEKYEKSLEELNKCTPQYMESMEQVFDQCQQHEVKRLTFLKEALLDIKRHLNLTENQRSAHDKCSVILWICFLFHSPFYRFFTTRSLAALWAFVMFSCDSQCPMIVRYLRFHFNRHSSLLQIDSSQAAPLVSVRESRH